MSKNAVKTLEMIESENKPYILRSLCAEDIFPLITILRKIGFKEIKNCFSDDAIHKILGDVMDIVTHRTKPATDETETAVNEIADGGNANGKMVALGLSVLPTALDVVDIVLGNIEKCETDIYKFLANLSNLSVNEIKKLSLVDFADMVLDVVTKEEFKDFIKVVSKRFK